MLCGFKKTGGVDMATDALVSRLLCIGMALMDDPKTRCDEADADSNRREAVDAGSASLSDTKTLMQLCVVLADAWSGLASVIDGDQSDRFAEGARIAYSAVLAVAAAHASTHGRRLLRAKERRRLERAEAAGAASQAQTQAREHPGIAAGPGGGKEG